MKNILYYGTVLLCMYFALPAFTAEYATGEIDFGNAPFIFADRPDRTDLLTGNRRFDDGVIGACGDAFAAFDAFRVVDNRLSAGDGNRVFRETVDTGSGETAPAVGS